MITWYWIVVAQYLVSFCFRGSAVCLLIVRGTASLPSAITGRPCRRAAT